MRVVRDTCVLAEVQRSQGHSRPRAQVETLDPMQAFLRVVTVGELAKSIALLPAGTRKRELSSWLLGLEQHFADAILPVDVEAATIWGELTAHAQTRGIQIPASDGLIAATALRHGLHLMTRKTRHFAATGALIVDPWAE